jgi:hypothetical protein
LGAAVAFSESPSSSAPDYEHVVSQIADIPLTLGQPAIILWLLIRGAKDQPLEAAP